MYPKILKNVFYPLVEMRFPQEESFSAYFRLLEKTQWWSPTKLKEFQQKKLNELLKHAYENVPYYHRMFNQLGLKPQDIKNVDKLRLLPILTKEIVRNNFDNLTSKNYSKDKLISSATGGSTGEPMRFFVDRRCDASNRGAAHRDWSWAGYELGDKIAYLWAATHDLSAQANLKNKIINLMERRIFLDAFSMTEKTLDTYIIVLRKFKPKFINSYASSIYLLARYMEKEGIEDINPTAILTTADMLFDHQRDTIENAFGCKVFDYYSGRDTSLHAAECSEHSGYHLTIENAIAEFVKNDENVVAGESGKIIITDLSNYAMPFIRYEIGDLGEPSDEICPCGRGLPLMKSIKGRILDTILTLDGRYLTGEFFPAIFADYDIKGINEFQVIQKRKDKLLIKLVKGNSYSEDDLNLYIRIIRKHVGTEMNIDVKFVKAIEPTGSGKHRPIISEVKLNL